MLALWSTPCSTSTAFESMMSGRGDFRCLIEPFGMPYYRGADRRTTRFDENAQDMSVTYASTWADLQREHRKGRLFMRELPNHVMHLSQEAFLGEFQHTFLIQHPAQALPAMYDHWSTFTMDECCFQAMRELFDQVVATATVRPVVIDTVDLAADIHAVTEAYCKAVDIPFLPEAIDLTGASSADQSTVSDESGVDDVPFLREMYQRCLPHYQALAQHKL